MTERQFIESGCVKTLLTQILALVPIRFTFDFNNLPLGAAGLDKLAAWSDYYEGNLE
jgi:hypothetical protein